MYVKRYRVGGNIVDEGLEALLLALEVGQDVRLVDEAVQVPENSRHGPHLSRSAPPSLWKDAVNTFHEKKKAIKHHSVTDHCRDHGTI
jgi:hypothetical protein